MVNTIGESTRQLIADRIKTGAALEGASATLPDQAKTTPHRGKDRSR
jgi:cell filamentation protein